MHSIRTSMAFIFLALVVCLPFISCDDNPASHEKSDPLGDISDSEASIVHAAMNGLIVAQSTTGTVAVIPEMISLPTIPSYITRTGTVRSQSMRQIEQVTPIDTYIDSDSDGENDVHQVGQYVNFVAEDTYSGYVKNEAKNTWIADAVISLVDTSQDLNMTGTIKTTYYDEDSVQQTASYMDTDLKTTWTRTDLTVTLSNQTDIDYGMKIFFPTYELVLLGNIKTDGEPFTAVSGAKGTSSFVADLNITYYPKGSNNYTNVYLTSNCSVTTENYCLLGVMKEAKWYVAIGEKNAKKHGPFTNAQLDNFINNL